MAAHPSALPILALAGAGVAGVVVLTRKTPAPGTGAVPIPVGLVVSNLSQTGCDLTWTPSAGAVGYTPYEGGVALAATTTASTHITGLTPSTAYRFTVDAVDATGKHTAQSAALAVTTLPVGAVPPPAPVGLTASAITATACDVNWTASTGATGYSFYEDGTLLGTTATTAMHVTGLTASSTHSFTVAATGAGGTSAQSAPLSVTTLPPPPTAPATPVGLVASNVTATGCDLAWTASAGATSYTPRQGGTVLASTPTTAATITGLAPGRIYHFTVDATGPGGTSAPCAPITVTTLAVVTPPPATPTGLAASAVTATGCDLTCNPSATATRYTFFENGVHLTESATPGCTVTGLVSKTRYRFAVSAGNAGGGSLHSAPITVTTP